MTSWSITISHCELSSKEPYHALLWIIKCQIAFAHSSGTEPSLTRVVKPDSLPYLEDF